MNRLRNPYWVLIMLFAGILAVVPLVQTVKEIGGDDGVSALEFFGDLPTAVHLRTVEKKLEGETWAGRASRPWLQFAHFAWLKEGGEKAVIGSDGWYFFKPGLQFMVSRHEHEIRNDTNDPVAAIVHFRDQLAAHGVKLLVFTVPNKDSIYPDLLSSRAKPSRGILTPRTREVLDAARAAGVEVVDLFKVYTEARSQNSATPLYLKQDTHWSPVGIDLAAKTVANRLVELGWLKPGNAEYSEKAAPVQRTGDIVRMLQSPIIEKRIAPESVSTVQVLRGKDGKPYVDEPEAEVLVLGDSFMRIYQQDAPTSAGFISHLAKELKQPLMSIINDGGGATLVREELGTRPIFLQNKKVLVWEFVERDIGLAAKGWRRVMLPPIPRETAGRLPAQ